MRHVRMLGLCLVAALALGAYAVSSASALEWGKCEFVGSGGNYTGPNCNKAAGEKAKPKGTGEYEWRKASEVAEKREAEGKPANISFSGGGVEGGGVLTSTVRECRLGSNVPQYRTTRQGCAEAGGTEYSSESSFSPTAVECATEASSGETEGKNKVANVNVVFTGCVLFGALPCNTAGKEEGEIITSTLKGKLGWINKSAKEVGVLLEPAAHHGHFADFECTKELIIGVGVGNKKEGTEYTSAGCAGKCPGTTPEEEKHGGYDGVISPITPVNQMTSEFTQVFSQEPEWPFGNIPSKFEGKHIDLLEDYQEIINSSVETSSQWQSAGEVVKNVVTPEEAGEIKA